MEIRKIVRLALLVALIATFGETATCLAGEYPFTISDPQGDAAHGLLSAGPSGQGDGSVLVTGGFIDVTASSSANIPTGNYPVLPYGPADVWTGSFGVDNLLYPNNDANNGVNSGGISSPSYVDPDGLIFGTPGLQINIWGNGNADYAFYGWTSTGGYGPTNGSGATFTLIQVPEPSSLILAGMGAALAIGLAARRRRRV